MNPELIILAAKLRKARTPEEIAEAKALGESFLKWEKSEALLTLMTIAGELGEEELLSGIDSLRNCLSEIVKKVTQVTDRLENTAWIPENA